jgi:DNA-binding transcriptional ArsR family regulator
LGRPPDRLYYHLGLLERHGIVHAVERRGSERRYQAVGEITVAPGLSVPPAAIDGVVANILDQVAREYAAASRRKGDDAVKRVMLAQRKLRLTEDQRAELAERLNSLAAEYEQAEHGGDVDGDDRREYGVITGLWPVVDE